MSSARVVTQTQPGRYAQGSNEWSSGICDFCENIPVCCFAYWCFPCFACKTSRDYGEHLCLPLADWFGFIPPATMSLRASMRHRYGISGTLCEDCVYSTFCMVCVWCQMSREMEIRNTPAVVVTSKR
ncbi:cornifelin-like [Archocentrus centrarchus]|uniref:cornifelin-like n=1 Tax=Archocentrus centrarchus TaxID=63155 RepID=UPI0011EA222F|nr:cornifelin-like [Archocentrus centrarchus]